MADCKVCHWCKNGPMGLERLNVNAEKGIIRAQENSMTLSDVAKGYESEVSKVMESTAAPAIRYEVQKYVGAITTTEGPEQLEHLNKLVRALEAYKSTFKDIWTDEKERAPFALALALREKSLQ